MATRTHWLNEIANEVISRAQASIDDIAAGIQDRVPFGNPPPKPQEPTLSDFMQADPQQRQAILEGSPDSSGLMSKYMNEAVTRYGAMAQKILPALRMEDSSNQANKLQQEVSTSQQGLGIAAAHQDILDMLGIDPFSPG